ncbi:MAG: isopropylmalate isomerase [Roseobacter sp.]
MSHCTKIRIDIDDRARLRERFFGATRSVIARA